MKILNTTQHSTTVKLILGVLIAVCVFTAAANAQPRFVGTFTMPYGFQWNHTVLPAGEYSIQVGSRGMPAVLRSKSGNGLAYTNVPIEVTGGKGAACLTLTIRGNERKVRSMNLPQIGLSFNFEQLTQTERETLAKEGHVESVPVLTAQK